MDKRRLCTTCESVVRVPDMRIILLLLLILASPVGAADEDTAFYPMKVGSRWTYRMTGQDDRMIVTAAKEEKLDGRACVRFERKINNSIVAVEHVAILPDGCYRLTAGGSAVEPAICFLKASGRKGDIWKQDFKIGDVATTTKYELGIQDVEVPSGKYKGALVVRAETIEKEMTTKAVAWYAKGTGMVKQVIELRSATVTLELEKAEFPGR
jgi:hypothetical protein